jgi:hypothetical protein
MSIIIFVIALAFSARNAGSGEDERKDLEQMSETYVGEAEMADQADQALLQQPTEFTGNSTDRGSDVTSKFKYRAFITYNHADRRAAEWIHKAIESYRIPKSLVGQPGRDGPVPERLFPLFRDRDELSSSPDLSAAIREALAQSAYLIALCSPASSESRWVNAEIMEFKRLGRSDRIHALIVEGRPNLGSAEGGCFPPALRFALGSDGTIDELQPVEPLAADMRPEADGKKDAKLKLIAGLLGVPFDALRRRDSIAARQHQRKVQAIAGSMTLLAVSGAIAGYIAYLKSEIADLRQIPGIRVDKRETTLDLSGWKETTAADIANHVKKSLAVSRNKFTIVRTREHATTFVHIIGSTSGITPEVDCHGQCRMVPRDPSKESRAPNEWNLEFEISDVPLDQSVVLEFNVSFWNAFQEPTQWWGGFRILHQTKSSTFSIQFPETRHPLPETLKYVYYDRQERSYDDEIRVSLRNDTVGRVAKLTWEVPYPSGDRSYRVKWDWSR